MTDENIHIGALLKEYFKYWKIYVHIGIICLIGSIVFILITPKEYKITAQMQLRNEEKGMMSELKMLKSSGVGSLLGGSKGRNSDDELLLVSSYNNLVEVIRRTGYQVETRTQNGLKKVLLSKDESPVSYQFSTSFLDTISAPISLKLVVKNDIIETLQIKSSLFNKIEFENKSFPFHVNLPVGFITIGQNMKSEGTFYTQISPLQKTYENLKNKLSIYLQDPGSNIIVFTYDAENKDRECELINTLMDRYNEYSLSVRQKETNINAIFIKNRLDTVTSELAILERKIELYKQVNKMPDPGLYGSITYAGNKETERLILDTETRLRMIDYVIDYIRKPANVGKAIPLLDGLGEKIIISYNELVFKRQQLAMTSEANNPMIQFLDVQIREQQNVLIESVVNIRKNIQIGLDALKAKDFKLSEQVDKLPSQEREYVEMLRQQKIKETIYLFLMQKVQEKELANSPDELAARIIDKAYASYKHIYPKGTIIISIAFILACILSLVVISFKIFAFKK